MVNSVIIFAYGMLKDINIQGLTNANFRKTPISACQPDMAFYVGKDLVFPPHNNSPVNLNQLKPPNLVVEIAATSLVDDTSNKLKLYQRLGVWEYWVVDVATSRIIATCLSVTEITHIRESQVLPGLKIDLIELALRRSSTEGHIAATRWLLANLST
jgi:Uma2 family endonuclease